MKPVIALTIAFSLSNYAVAGEEQGVQGGIQEGVQQGVIQEGVIQETGTGYLDMTGSSHSLGRFESLSAAPLTFHVQLRRSTLTPDHVGLMTEFTRWEGSGNSLVPMTALQNIKLDFDRAEGLAPGDDEMFELHATQKSIGSDDFYLSATVLKSNKTWKIKQDRDWGRLRNELEFESW